ncbi:MAG TPA: SDR family NAD(P)-dependent oxidoreductase, partial [Magnetovibrio sp.]
MKKLKTAKQAVDNVVRHASGDIAVVGLALRFPGAEDLDAFWEILKDARCMISELPAERWSGNARLQAMIKEAPEKVYGGFVDHADTFDASFFGISPREAKAMDPQQRFMLELSWKAMEDAGYAPAAFANTRTGVFMGSCHWDYAELFEKTGTTVDAYLPTGTAYSIIANRVSYWFDLKGPSVTNDTACSSSLVAVQQAVQALRSGECTAALAGGVNLIWSPNHFIAFHKNGMLSKHGRSHAFDRRADGYVRGEGGAVLVLKTLEQARADGDAIYAVIKGVGSNHGGRTSALTVTSPQAQADLIYDVHRSADVPPSSVSYIEAHGTGTPVGDPIEMLGLKKAFASLYEAAGEKLKPGHCAVGSIKTNIGHLEGAAGIAGMIKVIAAMQHGQLPPNHDYQEPNPMLRLDGSPFRIADRLTPWKAGANGRLRAGVSSFGFGGTNAHALLESVPHKVKRRKLSSAVLVPLSARDGERLTEMASVLVSWLERHHDVDLAALAYTLQTGRVPMEARLACVVESVDALVDKLRAFVADRFGEVEGLWWSQEVTHNRFVGMVDKDEDGLALIKTWMRKRRFDQLAELWVGGGAFDWLGLWQKSRPQRIHLPTYPFARHRYWYAQEENTVMTGVPVASLHPLLAENRSSFAGNRFIAHLRKQDAVLSDHVIGEKHVLPGVAVLEIVCAAACRAFDLDDPVGLGLEGVVWLRPIVVDANERELEVRLEQQPNGIATFSVHSADEENAAPFCQGRVMPGGKAPLPFDLAALRAECPEVVASKTCYARLMAAGIAHGPAFRVLGNVSKGNDCAVAELHLPETSAGRGVDDARWGLHPILVDAAIQVIAALVGDGQTAGIPFAVDAVRISGPWQRDMVGVVKVLGAHRYDVTLCAPDGSVRVHLAGLVTRALEGESTTVAKSKIVTATPMWAEITNVANGPTQSMDLPTTVLVAASLLDASSVAAFAHTNITLVPLALAEADDAEGSQAILYDVLERFQGLMQAGTPTRLLAFMPDGHPLLPALCALIGTVTQESSRVSGRVIAVEGTVTLDAKSVVAECAHAGPPVVRLIANGKRQARRFVSKALENPARGFVWPEGSVAWVSGGGGGLGRKLADHLLQQGVETVVLSSRSDLTGALPDGMVGLPVDVTDLDAVVATAKTIRKRYGRLDGVFHAAGVLRDGLAVSKKPCDFSAVAAPKMRGAVALDRATADDPLTAFVLFSSIASVHGNPGQVDYAAANGYLDGLADWRRKEVDAGRRHGRTLALNWPLWSDGGMRVDDASLSALKRRMGVDPLPTSVGMAVLDAALSSELQQVAVSYGSSDMAADYLTNGPVMPDAVVKSKPTASSHEVISHEAGPELRERLVDHLRGQLGAVLDMDPDTIRPDVGFDTYGFDSIVAVEVIGRLEEAFGILPKTLFFEYVNLNGVADYLISSHHEAVENFFGAASKAIEGATSPEPSVSPPVAAAALSAPAIMRAGRDDRHAIAVIGVGGRYPGADNLDEFWDNLAHGRHAFTPIPTERWPHEEIYFPERDVVGKSTIKTGGFLRDIDAFDPRYFNISQRDAELMSPEVRLLLQVAVETFEDAGYSRETLQADYEGDVGVLVGTMSNHYNLYGVQNMLTRGARASGSYTGTMPNMVSYYYGLTGPSIFVDTMCSASSTAVDLAVRLLREGQTRMVLAGGVNLLLHPYNMISSSQEHFTTKTAEVIRSFGLGADGTILGEGVGTVLLKPLREAERDGDNIQGVILGTAMSNAGVRNGFTVPSPALQAKAVRLALEDAGVDPQTISYLEAHGSGTRLGDPIEM